jgi:hypothetical protein
LIQHNNTAIALPIPTADANQEVTQEAVSKSKEAPVVKQTRGLLGLLSARGAEIVGIGVTLGSGWLAAWNSIRNNFYQNTAKYDVFKDIRDKRDNSYTEMYREFKGQQDAPALIKEVNQIEKEYTAAVEERLRGYGIKTTLDRWRTLKTHQKTEALLAFSGVSAVLLGVVASLGASRRVEEKQEALSEKLQEQDNGRGH